MADQNSNNENQQRRLDPELLKKGLRCDLDQYDMLKRCSDKKDMTEWNEWREEHSEYDVQDVLLEGGDFSNWHLEGVNLGTHREYGRNTPEVYICKAKFNNAHLEGAQLYFAHMEDAELYETHLEGAKLVSANLNNAFMLGVHLDGAWLQFAKLHNANVCNSHLDKSNCIDSELQDGEFDNACLIGAQFRKARVSGSTSFCFCKVDRKTDFREVALGSVQIDPATRQLLEYNIRRMNWEEWYKNHRLLKFPVRLFWCFSDYGISTWQIIDWFFGLALIFAGIYYLCALVSPPGIVHGLINGQEGLVPAWLLPFRSIYFSIVTMTTLGFGDMHANCQSFWGHLLIGVQVLLGYVILGALVTRFAVLFTAGGPAGHFTNDKK